MTADRRGPGAPTLLTILLAGVGLLVGGARSAVAAPAALGLPVLAPGFTAAVFARAPATAPATSGPDDIARLGDHVFVGWQNGVGTMGEPNPRTGQDSSTVVEYAADGSVAASYSLVGKVEGMAGDPLRRRIVATVNEDGNSSLYTITPGARAGAVVVHYAYSPRPDAAATGGVLTGGGSDGVSIYGTRILLTASAPAAPDATAAFQVRLIDRGRSHIARLTPTFAENSAATDAVTGQPVALGLMDPDSNAVVPFSSPRFGGQFVVSGQADQQLVFAGGRGSAPALGARLTDRLPGFFEGLANRGAIGSGSLTRLALTKDGSRAGTDDVRWVGDSGRGTLYVVDNKAATVYSITGPFAAGQAFGSLDNLDGAPANTEVDQIDLATGALTPFATGLGKAKGLIWVP